MKKIILEKNNIYPGTDKQFNIYLSCIIHLMKIQNIYSLDELIDNTSLLEKLKFLDLEEFNFIKSKLNNNTLSISQCQEEVQKDITFEKRKALAAYFTNSQGLSLMSSVIKSYQLKAQKKKYNICDPFLGSARTLICAINELGKENIGFVFGVEPFYLSALVGYTSLLQALDGDSSKIVVINGDSFEEIPKNYPQIIKNSLPKIDIILTNPPFTRWEYLTEEQQTIILKHIKNIGYKEYMIRKDAGLQIYSMFLCDYILEDKGLIISVLPLSTFYTIGGRGFKELLKKKYNLLALIESALNSSFSDDSEFKEIILIAKKDRNYKKTIFTNVIDNYELIASASFTNKVIENANYYDINTLPRFLDNNWLALFPNGDKFHKLILEMVIHCLKNEKLDYWDILYGKEKIVRGFEMYGVDFFFIPNKFWDIVNEDDEKVLIKNIESNQELNIQKYFLVNALRQPKLYYKDIEPEINTFALNLPETKIEKFPHDIREYITWGIKSKSAENAIKNFGKYWYSHINKSLLTKKPYGHVFIADKVDLLFKNRSIFSNFKSKEFTASKNFYILRGFDLLDSKCLCAWFNSSIFISMLILANRKISQTWTRLLIDDYLNTPVINLNKISEKEKNEIGKSFEEFKKTDLPDLWQQLGSDTRKKLDYSITKAIKIENPIKFIDDLHEKLEIYSKSLKD